MTARTITIVGSGDAVAHAGRSHASAVVRVAGGPPILIDAGDGVSRALAELGQVPVDLGAILLTHLHPDHAAGLPGLIQQLRLAAEPPKRPIPLLLPPEALPELEAVLRFFGLDPPRVSGAVDPHPLVAGEPLPLGSNLFLRALRNDHLPSDEASTLKNSFSFEFSHGRHRLYYSGDLSSIAEVERDSASADLAILDAGHLEQEAATAAALAAGARSIVLTHRSDGRRPIPRSELRVSWAEEGREYGW